ncbi:H subunit of photosynthetic reaction center complex [beta proteobacterium AAP51]|nr:H subunit of photosynthetic reaction center complex [beta proteobacterium AAP51]
MGTGAITQYVNVAQLVLYAFWIFFAFLIYYLSRENHREGYPLVTEGGMKVTGFPIPAPKTYLLADGSTFSAPNDFVSPQVLAAEPTHRWAGAPLVPTGANPMLDGIGPGAWADRADHPDHDYHGHNKVQPLRLATDYDVQAGDTDPRGLPVVGADGVVGGTVVEMWVDVAESLFRYYELEVASNGRRVLLPMNFARCKRDKVTVGAILGHQFADVPGQRSMDQVTMLEEEKIQAYYGAGTLYAEPSRAEPLL